MAPSGISTPQELLNDTVVMAGSTTAITDASGNAWTVTATNTVDENGAAAGYTANVAELAYVNGTIWAENTAAQWYNWSGSTWNGGSTTSPLPAASTPTPTPSPNDTMVMAGSTAAISDASGNTWTISSGGQVAINGAPDTTTANVIELAYVNGTIWQENSSKLWWGETQPNASWAPAAGIATSPLPATPTPTPTPTPAPTPKPSPNDTVVTGTTAAITDASGNKWTITAGGQVAVNGAADTTTANVTELAYVNGTIWQENNNKLWWGETAPTASWAPTAGTAARPLPVTATPAPTPAPTPVPVGTRDPSQTPFASTSVFNLPLGTGAQWQSNAQLSSASAYVNTANLSGYNETIYKGTASDPLVTVTNNAGAGGTAGTFQVHIPVGAVPAPGGDETLSVDDSATHTWYSFGGFQWTGSNTATVNQGSGESDTDSGITVAGSNWDEGVGTLRESDLQAGTIDHMLRIELPMDMLLSYSQTSTSVLAPYAWPQTEEDGFAINGNGGPPYTGTIPYGVTIGIPITAVEPAAVAANAGANMLWKALQDHGAMVRDSGGSGNGVIFQADQTVDGNDPLIVGMEQYSSQIMAAAQILTNQGPNSINGGGTPVVPLDPGLSDATSGTPTPTPVPTPASVASANDTMVLAGSPASIVDASGNTWTITSGGQVAVNGVADSTTGNVTELAYVNAEVWQENASNLWWGKSSPAASWAPVAGTGTPLPAPVAIASGTASETVSQSEVSVVATAGTHIVFLKGSGNIVALSGGADTVTDSGTGNTYILPAAGKGTDAFTSNILTAGDTLDLKTALAETNWNGTTSTLSQYLTVTDSGPGATLAVAPTSGGTGVAIATIAGATKANLTSLLAHAIT